MASGTAIDVYDQLPPNVAYTSAIPTSAAGQVTPTRVLCSVVSGTVSTGQRLKCTVTLPTGGLPMVNGSASFNLNITPTLDAVGQAPVSNAAVVDPTGANAVMDPTLCTANFKPIDACTVTTPIPVDASGPIVRMNVIGQGSGALTATFNNPAASGSATGGASGGAGWLNVSVLTGAASGGAVGTTAQSQGSAAAQLLKPGLGARIAVTSASQIMGGSCTVTDSSGQSAAGAATFVGASNSFVLDSDATRAGRIVNCTVTIAKQASMAWNITMSPNDGGAYVFATTAGPTSPNGLTSMGPFRVVSTGYTSGYTTLTKLYTDTQMGGYNGWGSYMLASGMFVGGSFASSWTITDVVCTDMAASLSGNPTDSWSVPFTWPQATFTVASSYIKPGAQILCKMIYGKAGLSLRKTNPPQLVPGVAASYTLNVATSAIPTLMDPVLTVVDQLPPNVDYVAARPVPSGGFSDASCTPSGDVRTGLLLSCQVTRQPPVPYGGVMSFEIIVRPSAASLGQSLRNVAVTSPTGSGPALNPASCIADGNPQGCAVTTALTVGGRSLGLTVKGNQPGTYTFSGNNGWVTQVLTVTTAGTPVVGDPQALSASAITTLNLSSSVSGQAISAVTCTGLGGGSVSFSATSLSLDAKATALGNAVSCNVTLGSVLLNLSKSNPASLQVGATGSYNLVLSNKGTAATSSPYTVVFDQLPPNVQYTGMTVFTPPGGLTLTASSSCSASGTVAAGQLVTCNLYPPAGGIPANGGQVGIKLNVTPQAPAPSSINKAAVDATGANAVQTPASCTADGVPMAGCAVAPALSIGSLKPFVSFSVVGQGGDGLSASFNNPAGSGSLTGGASGGAGWVNASLTTGTATGGAVGVPASSQVSTAPQSLVTALGARIAVTSTSQILGGSCTVTDSLGQTAPGSAVFNPTSNSFVLDSAATEADRVVNCTVTVGKQATMAWNVTLVPFEYTGYVFRMEAGPSSPNGLTGGGGIVSYSSYTWPATPLTKLYTDTQMGGYNGWANYGTVYGEYVGGSFGPSWYITDLVCSDSAANLSGNPTDSWRLPFTWPQANFTVPASYIKPGAQIVCKMIYGKAGLTLSKTNPPQLVPGVAASYTLGVAAPPTFVMDPVLNVVDQLAPNMEFVSARPVSGGGLSAVSCTPSGDVASGLLLTCQITRQPPLPANNTMSFEIIVRPTAAALGQSVRNVAITSPTGSGAALNPASCTANGTPQGCAVTTALTVGGRSLGLTVKGNQPGTYTFSGNNGWVTQVLTVTTAGTPVVGDPQALSASAITTLNLSSSVSGQAISAVTCTGLGGGSVSFSATSLSLDAKATALGNAVSCSVTLGSALSLSLNKISVGGVGSFSFAGNNGWTPQTLVTTTAGTPVSGATQSLTQTGVATRITETLPAGWNLAQVSCVDQNAATSGNPASVIQPPITAGNTFELPASVVRSGAALVCTVTNSYGGYTLSCQVLLDNGRGAAAGGVAHDGVQNGSETGHAGVLVQFTDCANVVYASAVSDGSGLFALSTSGVPPGPACLVQALPENYVAVNVKVGNTGGSYDVSTRTLRFTLAANTNYSGVVFANVPKSQLLGEGAQQLVSGQSVFYAHHYVAGTSVSVAFSSSDQPSNSADRWSSLIYGDSNCNGRLDAGETVLTGAISVQAGQQLCLLLRVNSPAGLSVGARNESTLEALEVFQPQPTSGPGLVNRLTRVDISTIGSAQGGTLSLLKQVRRVDSCPSTAADTLPFATSNQAQPGQYVEYQVVYSNNSAGPLTAIRLSDAVPTYTQYRSAACGPLPAGLQSCNLVQQPAVGATGSLLWELADAPATAAAVGLQPGASGAVVFCVQIQR